MLSHSRLSKDEIEANVEIEARFERLRRRLHDVKPHEIASCLDFGVYYFVCGVHAQHPGSIDREPHTRVSLVDGGRHLFPLCQRGCAPSRESLVLSSKRPICPNCIAVYRIDVPLGACPIDVPGPHVTESQYFTLPRAEWPEVVTKAIDNRHNELSTALGPIYWSREESTLMQQSLLLAPQRTPVDFSWDELRQMSLVDYVNKYAADYKRARDPTYALLQGYAPPSSGIVTVQEMDTDDAPDNPTQTMTLESSTQAIVPYVGQTMQKDTVVCCAAIEVECNDPRAMDACTMAPCDTHEAHMLLRAQHGSA